MNKYITFLKRYSNLFLVVFSPILFFLMVECLFRFTPGLNQKTGPLMIKGPFGDNDYIETDRELFWKFRPNIVIKGSNIPINNLGFRGEDYTEKRFASYTRILCLGDSVTFDGEVGFGLGYPERLGYYLNKTRPDPLYKVFNCGVPGYSSFQIMRFYNKYVDILKPAIVIIWTASNDRDLAVYYPDKIYAEKEEKNYAVRDFLRNSQFCVFLGGLIQKIQQNALPKNKQVSELTRDISRPSRVSLEDYRANLQEIIDISNLKNVRVIFITRHWYVRDKILEQYNDVLRDVAKKNNVEVVDIAVLFKKPWMAVYYNRPAMDWVHLNRAGYDLVAKQVAQSILVPIFKD
jgi:lysophospholipase L1-like esterase